MDPYSGRRYPSARCRDRRLSHHEERAAGPAHLRRDIRGYPAPCYDNACSFALLKMNDNTQALALPEGSVRAIIALSMLVIFLMLSVFLYSDQATNSRPQTLNGLTKTQVDAIPRDEIIAGPTPATGSSMSVTILLPRNPVS